MGDSLEVLIVFCSDQDATWNGGGERYFKLQILMDGLEVTFRRTDLAGVADPIII